MIAISCAICEQYIGDIKCIEDIDKLEDVCLWNAGEGDLDSTIVVCKNCVRHGYKLIRKKRDA